MEKWNNEKEKRINEENEKRKKKRKGTPHSYPQLLWLRYNSPNLRHVGVSLCFFDMHEFTGWSQILVLESCLRRETSRFVNM